MPTEQAPTAESIRDVGTKVLEERVASGRKEVLAAAAGRDTIGRLSSSEIRQKSVALAAATRLGAEAADELARRAQESRLEEVRRRTSVRPSVLRQVLELGHPELVGQRLVGSRLTREEKAELGELARALRTEGLDEESTSRFEVLVGTAAGDPELYAKVRVENAAMRENEALLDDLHVSLLRRRPKLAEPGSVELPRQLFEWVKTYPERFGLLDLGVWALVALALENQDASLFVGATGKAWVELDRDEPAIALRAEGLGDVRLRDGSTNGISNGPISHSLRVLKENGLIAVDRSSDDGVIRIRRGELGRKLREGAATRT